MSTLEKLLRKIPVSLECSQTAQASSTSPCSSTTSLIRIKTCGVPSQPLAVYHWSPAAVSFAEFDRISPKQRKGYHLQELMVLQHWFTMNLSQLKKIIVLPEEEILKCDMGSTGDDISHLKSRIEEHENSSSHESNLPVIVFIHKINPHIVNFKHYLEAYLKKYAEDFSRQQVICVFHVENLSVKECPEIDLGRTRRDRHVTFFSAFNPAEKPVTLLIADVRDRR